MADEIPATLLLDADVIDDPYEFYGCLRERAPVWRVPGTEVFLITSYDLLAEAAGRVEDFSSNMHSLLYRDEDGLPVRLPFGDAGVQTLAIADPPAHTVHRSTVFPELVAKRMADLEPEVVEATTRGMDRALDERRVDFMATIGNAVPITIISRLIGFRDADLDLLLRAAFDSTSMLGSMLSLDGLLELVARSGQVGAWIDAQLATALQHPGEDILGSVAGGVSSGAFGLQEANVMLHTLLSAGGESTTSLLGNAVRLLAEHPHVQDHLRDRPESIPQFVEEALRLESPFRFLFRSTHAATALGGVDIPAGATILMMWGAANRDPAEFDRPDEIDLQREVPRRHVAFGRGIHHCVGAPLARLEARVVLTELLRRTACIELDADRPPRWVSSLQVRRHDLLPVQLTPR